MDLPKNLLKQENYSAMQGSRILLPKNHKNLIQTVQEERKELKQTGKTKNIDEPKSIMPSPRNEVENYQLVNGVIVPKNLDSEAKVEIIEAGHKEFYKSIKQNNTFNDYLIGTIENILQSIDDKTERKKADNFFQRIVAGADLLMSSKENTSKNTYKGLYSPIIINREIYIKDKSAKSIKEEEKQYHPLSKFSLDQISKKTIENIIYDFIIPDKHIHDSSQKKIGLRLLTNYQFIKGLDTGKITDKVIEALKNDFDLAAKKNLRAFFKHTNK